jgi:uncharacterized protein YidB (DUF937 family)
MTLGELAMLFNAEQRIGARLTVIPMRGYQRSMWYDETGLTWVNPSPNLRSVDEATLYAGVGLIEGANVSVGRGTTSPFELIGAPWIDGTGLAGYLARREIGGVRFEPTDFTPDRDRYAGRDCRGVRITLTDRASLDVARLGLELTAALYRLYPTDFKLSQLLLRHWAEVSTGTRVTSSGAVRLPLHDRRREIACAPRLVSPRDRSPAASNATAPLIASSQTRLLLIRFGEQPKRSAFGHEVAQHKGTRERWRPHSAVTGHPSLTYINAAIRNRLYARIGHFPSSGGTAMRLIHQVIADLRDRSDDTESPMDAALEELLGGERGSLPDLADRFAAAGRAHIMASWIGNGPNLPISTKDLRLILGEERAEDLATLTGLSSEDFLVHLARRLPAAVHRMTPGGEMGTAI